VAAAKRRGVRLGGHPERLKKQTLGAKRSAEIRSQKAMHRATDYAGLFASFEAEGATSARAIARRLNEEGYPSPSGRGLWQTTTVQRVKARLDRA